MKNSTKLKMGIVALTLATVLTTQSVPMEVWEAMAEGVANILTTDGSANTEEILTGGMVDKYNIGSGYIIQENVEKRTLTTKEFLMSDDTILVQQYAAPVHYLENGEYKEIDNSLTETTTEAGQTVYENTANSLKVRFNKENQSNTDFIEIEEDGYRLELGYKAKKQKKVKAKAKGFEKKEKTDYKNKKYKKPVGNKVPTGEITYEEIESDTNITYQIKNNVLSESIVIGKQQTEYSYTFEIKSSGLELVQNADGSISATNPSGKTKFIFSAPYMTDCEGKYSDRVSYALSTENGRAQLTLTADAEWLNEETNFPVTLSPEIKSAKNKEFAFANVFEDGETVTGGAQAYAGKKGGEKKSDVFMNFKLPQVSPYYQLIGATVSFDYQMKGMGGFTGKDLYYDVYVAESTNDLSSIAYTQKPERLQTLNAIEQPLQFSEKTLSYESETINTANLQSNTLTLAIESGDETTEYGYIALPMTASETAEVGYFYQRVIGIKDDYSMESFEVNGATAYINNGTGYLTSVFELASVNTLSAMPFEVSLIYNDYYSELLSDVETATGITIPSLAGLNFKLNFQQFIIAYDNVYGLIDADGSISTFHALGAGLYYSKDKELYYNSSTGIVYDLQGNQMKFTGGRLTEISSQNDTTEYIKVVYASTSSYQISRVEYYANSTLKYTINFTYSNDRIVSVTTNADSTMPLTKDLEYDTDGTLISIKNKTNNETGVQTIMLGYRDPNISPDRLGMLNYIYDNQKCGIIFDRKYDNTIYELRNMNGKDIYSNSRCSSNVKFDYYGIYTKIYYYENNVMTNMRYVSFNNSREVIAEWQQDSNGIVSVQASTNWKNASATGPTNYEKETCTYYHKSLPTNSDGINENGGQLTYTIGANSLEVGNHENYSFAIIFKVGTGDTETEILAGLNLSVKIGDSEEQNIVLDCGGRTYIVVPCGYYQNDTSVVITNRGSEYVIVEYFTYTLVNSEQEAYTYDATIQAHRLSSTTTSLRSGHYSHVTYDEKQRISTELTREISTDAVAETTTYSYYDASTDSNIAKGKIKAINTTEANSEAVDKTEYAYSGSWNNYTETVTTTQGELKMQTVYNIARASFPYVVTQTDENNIQTKGYYKPLSGDIRLWKVEYDNAREEYAYNNLGQITNINVYEGSNSTPMFSQTDRYDDNGVYLGSSYGGTKYTYGYDDTGFVTSIGYGGTAEDDSVTPLLQYSYYGNAYGMNGAIHSNQLYKKTYANGNVENYAYTQNSTYSGTVNKTQVDYKNTEDGSTIGSYIYNYNVNGAMISQSYNSNGYMQVSYDYGDLDNLEEQTLTINGLEFYFQYTQNYNTKNNQIDRSQIYSVIGCTTTDYRTLDYSYNLEGQVSGFSYGSYDVEYTYDKMGRLSNKKLPDYYTDIQNENYVYKTYGNGYTTNLLTLIEDQTYENNDRTATYDENGYVTSVSYNGNTYTYTYDGVGRLASETIDGATTTYTYDNYNNVQKTGLTYTNGKLTAVNGSQIVYDAMGNPTTYKGNTFNWEQGRKLASGTMNGNTFAYNYDGNGMRYEKTVNGTTTNYYWNGEQLLMESKNGRRIWYVYGVTGIEGMMVEESYRESVYYFDKNTLGDIVAIRDDGGNIVATYEYDAWGNVTVMDEYGSYETSSTFIGNINPFRYRGYYYDTETGFYYLQTRYYDPTIMRFINADNYELVASLSVVPGQLNMYAYCGNNPIMYTDETGEIAWIIALAVVIVGAIVGGIVGGVTSANNGNTGWTVVGDVFLGIGTGIAISGAGLLLGGMVATFAGASAVGIPLAALGAVALNVYPMIVMPLMGQKGMEPFEMKPAPQVTPMPPTTTGMMSISNYDNSYSAITRFYVI